jgi:hypothetical protein
MNPRSAFVLGLFGVLAALVHGGIYSAGHDFVVNRFTGEFRFVPAEDENEEQTPIAWCRALTTRRPGARFERLVRGGAERRAIRAGR